MECDALYVKLFISCNGRWLCKCSKMCNVKLMLETKIVVIERKKEMGKSKTEKRGRQIRRQKKRRKRKEEDGGGG